MKKFAVRSRLSTQLSLPSTSDIAFLLLIFFLATTIFDLEQGIYMVLPGQQSQSVRVRRDNITIVKAYADGSITIDNQAVQVSQIRPIIQGKLVQNAKTVVVIETHPDAGYGLMVDILDELRLAEARTISLKTMRGNGAP
jgi:biopolymer transport protein ExbD